MVLPSAIIQQRAIDGFLDPNKDAKLIVSGEFGFIYYLRSRGFICYIRFPVLQMIIVRNKTYTYKVIFLEASIFENKLKAENTCKQSIFAEKNTQFIVEAFCPFESGVCGILGRHVKQRGRNHPEPP